MDIQERIEEQIVTELEQLNGVDRDSDKYRNLVDGITKLADRAIELKKFEADCANKEMDYVYKEEQSKAESKDRKWKNGIAIAGIAVSVVLPVWGTYKTFKFEETGTVTTILGRGFINKLLPKK